MDVNEVSSTRLVWLRCIGISFHAWNVKVFKSISSTWGNFISVDKCTLEKLSFGVGRVLIFMSCSTSINGVVKLDLGGKLYLFWLMRNTSNE